MAEAYFFKFNANKWLSVSSKIQLLNHEEKGLFIDLCAMLLIENGKIKNDDFLHRKLRIDKAKLNNCLNLFSELKLLVFVGDFLSIKFIDESLCKMKNKSLILSENGKKGGRPKSKKKPSYQERESERELKEEEEEEEELSNSPLNPPGDFPNEIQKSNNFLNRVWLESGKKADEYLKLTKKLPELSSDDKECLENAGIKISDKQVKFFCMRAKALIGATSFSEEVHVLKSRVLERKVKNAPAYFNTLLEKAIRAK